MYYLDISILSEEPGCVSEVLEQLSYNVQFVYHNGCSLPFCLFCWRIRYSIFRHQFIFLGNLLLMPNVVLFSASPSLFSNPFFWKCSNLVIMGRGLFSLQDLNQRVGWNVILFMVSEKSTFFTWVSRFSVVLSAILEKMRLSRIEDCLFQCFVLFCNCIHLTKFQV